MMPKGIPFTLVALLPNDWKALDMDVQHRSGF